MSRRPSGLPSPADLTRLRQGYGGPPKLQRRRKVRTTSDLRYFPSTEYASRTLPGIPLAAYPDSTNSIPPAIAGPGPLSDPPRAGTSLTAFCGPVVSTSQITAPLVVA